MGALPGGGVLSLYPGELAAWFDVDEFRAAGRRVVVRTVDRPVLVLGSTQDGSIVDGARARNAGVQVVRRRSGGGAVLLEPGAQVWVDIWVPREDPFWSPEPHHSAERVGGWWAASFGVSGGAGRPSVHRGPAAPGRLGGLICFGGVAAGEVLVGGRKLVGLAQWRSRQGALVHGCAYRSWNASGITSLLAAGILPEGFGADLAGAAIGLEDAGASGWTVDALLTALPEPATWQVLRP